MLSKRSTVLVSKVLMDVLISSDNVSHNIRQNSIPRQYGKVWNLILVISKSG